MLSESYDIEREMENENRSSLCEREGYQYHIQCNAWNCECPCHNESED